MKGSIRIGSLVGIPILLHWTFPLLLIWIVVASSLNGSLGGPLASVIFVLTIFAVVVLHELGHALAARRFGIPTRDITLLPIGGVARLERLPKDPRQELVVALAGPAVNVGIAAILILVPGITQASGLSGSFGWGLPFLQRVFWVNLVMLAFNLIPAFPLDGGRVLRALLALRFDYARATRIAARIGQIFAVAFGLIGLFVIGNPLLVLIAAFVFFGAAREAVGVDMESRLSQFTVQDAMFTEPAVLTPSSSVSEAEWMFRRRGQSAFPVVDGDRLIGYFETSAGAFGPGSNDGVVGDLMMQEFSVCDPESDLAVAAEALSSSGQLQVPVVDGHRLVGILTKEGIGRVLQIAAYRDRQAV